VKKPWVALMIYGDTGSERNALTNENYRLLADAFLTRGFGVTSVLYNDNLAPTLAQELLQFDAVLVWVNPIEGGKDRQILDALLREVSSKGIFVTTHPDVILKIGTKDVLFKTRDMDWGSDTKIYTSYEDFCGRFPTSLRESGIRVLKQYRGDGGKGVFKVIFNAKEHTVAIIHAPAPGDAKIISFDTFHREFELFFNNSGLLIDQEWHENIRNGMVRCYLTGAKVSGFGYQEVTALYPTSASTPLACVPPSKRYYFTEDCGLFSDLKQVMEKKWAPELQEAESIASHMLPVIWDADFFIDTRPDRDDRKKYQLCEINVSCVSPFPPSAVRHIVEEVSRHIQSKAMA